MKGTKCRGGGTRGTSLTGTKWTASRCQIAALEAIKTPFKSPALKTVIKSSQSGSGK